MFNLDRVIAALKTENEQLLNELKRVRIAIAALQGLGTNGGIRRATASNPTGRKPNRMSAAGRRRISLAQKARWARWKAEEKKAA